MGGVARNDRGVSKEVDARLPPSRSVRGRDAKRAGDARAVMGGIAGRQTGRASPSRKSGRRYGSTKISLSYRARNQISPLIASTPTMP